MNLFYAPDFSSENPILPEGESKHAIRVLRMRQGDPIFVVDGKGNWYEGEVLTENAKRCEVEILIHKEDIGKVPYHLHMAVAPTKNNDRFEWFLEKATEIGISEITPIWCQNSERKKLNIDRCERILVSAMKQSLKSYLPKFNEPKHFSQFIAEVSESERLIAHCEPGDKTHLKNIPANQSTLILIGPEGDFSPDEIEKASQNDFKAISLGDNRLRTETAAIAACQTVYLAHV